MEHRGAHGEDLYQPCILLQLKPPAAKTEADSEMRRRFESAGREMKACVNGIAISSPPPPIILSEYPYPKVCGLSRSQAQAKEAGMEYFS